MFTGVLPIRASCVGPPGTVVTDSCELPVGAGT